MNIKRSSDARTAYSVSDLYSIHVSSDGISKLPGQKICDQQFYFIFDELHREKKPCVRLNEESDVRILVSVVTFAQTNHLNFDGSSLSRIFTSIPEMSRILSGRPSDNLSLLEQKLHDIFKSSDC